MERLRSLARTFCIISLHEQRHGACSTAISTLIDVLCTLNRCSSTDITPCTD